ncbi:MAG: hypothetical protein LBS74_03620 [Oscillospiraceae bacterium]|nr:hypothetical protein [Oscillospiraceae bacterium]
MKCPKCGRELIECYDCHGTGGQTSAGGGGLFGNLSCSSCNSTGYICPKCGKYWK